MATTTNKNSTGPESWAEYRRLVLAELERLDTAVSKLTQISLEHEKDLIEITSGTKAEMMDKLQKLKDETIERVRNMISEIKNELSIKESADVLQIETMVQAINDRLNKVQTEIKVLQGKAALLGFGAGLIVAIISIIAQISWNK
jgi:hypothetical protein